jgi:hypothetical protein
MGSGGDNMASGDTYAGVSDDYCTMEQYTGSGQVTYGGLQERGQQSMLHDTCQSSLLPQSCVPAHCQPHVHPTAPTTTSSRTHTTSYSYTADSAEVICYRHGPRVQHAVL